MNTSFLHMFSCHTEQAGEIWSVSDCFFPVFHIISYILLYPDYPNCMTAIGDIIVNNSVSLWDWMCLLSWNLEFSPYQELDLVHNESLYQPYERWKEILLWKHAW